MHRKLSSVLCDDLERWDGVGEVKSMREGGYISHLVDSLPCTAETDITL